MKDSSILYSRNRVLGVKGSLVLIVCFLSTTLLFGVSTSSFGRVVTRDELHDGFIIARVKYGGGGDWYGNKTSLKNLLGSLKERTAVKVASEEEATVEIMAEDFFNYPFLWISGHGNVRFTKKEAERLKKHLTTGGFLFADDDYGMDRSFREQMKQVFPDKQLVELPFTHQIYHCLYDLRHGPPKVHEHDGLPPRGYAIVHDGRIVVFYTHEADIGDGLEDPEIHGDPPDKREEAMKMALNVVVYSLTH